MLAQKRVGQDVQTMTAADRQRQARLVRFGMPSRPGLVEECLVALRASRLPVSRIDFFVDETRIGWQRVTVVTRPCLHVEAQEFVESLRDANPCGYCSLDAEDDPRVAKGPLHE